MSRDYGMEVEICGHKRNKMGAIFKAAKQEWRFKHRDEREEVGGMVMVLQYAEGSLCGGESEEEFTDRLALAIWKANGAYCEVTVDATYLNAPPVDFHVRDEEDFQRLQAK